MTKNKKKRNSEFWKKVHFKYRLSAINENTLEEVWKTKISIFSGATVFAFFAFFLIAITSVLIITTPIRYYLPGYMDAEIRGKAVETAIRIDSLEQAVRFQNAYMSTLKKVLSGSLDVDSVPQIDSAFVAEDDPILEMSIRERKFIRQYEDEERYNIGALPATKTPTSVLFNKPIKGIITQQFDVSEGKMGIDIQVATTENVLAVIEGTVVFTSYDLKNKHIVQLQHKNGYISTYMGCKQLVKKVGDEVKTGEVIAILGEKEGGTLNFELWNKGVPVNPEIFISFK